MAKATLTVTFPDAATKALLTGHEVVITRKATKYRYQVGQFLDKMLFNGLSVYREDTSATEIKYTYEYHQDLEEELSTGYIYLTINHPDISVIGIPMKIDMAARTVVQTDGTSTTFVSATDLFVNGVFTFLGLLVVVLVILWMFILMGIQNRL